MTPYKAIQHIHYKLSNVWKPTPKDVEAFEALRDYVAGEHKRQYRENELFAKLYVFAFSYFLKHYKTTVFNKVPQKRVNEYLDMPFSAIVERFTDFLNDSEQYILIDDVLPNKHPLQYTEVENDEAIKAMAEILKDPEKSAQLTKEVWKIEDVAQNLEIMINNALDTFRK